jgi:outer membrane immunogenic protein
VFGVEGDSSWGAISQTNGVNRADIDAMGTVRARFGYAGGNVLYYATGGLAWLHADTAAAGVTTRDQFWLGWTAGAGIEYALSQKWSAKVEYLYADYGLRDMVGGAVVRDDFNVHTIKLGVNYRAGVLDLLGVRW